MTITSNNHRSRARSSEVIAPGFGTRQDLERLSRDLSSDAVFPVEAVQALMECRGRGIRSRRHDGDATSQQQVNSTPVSSAWADFMKEEGVNGAPVAGGGNKKREEEVAFKPTESASKTYNLDFSVKKKKKAVGLLVQTGTLECSIVGRSKKFEWEADYTLTAPTILSRLKVHSVFTAGHACHSLAIASDGKLYGWGRNEASTLTSQLPKNVWAPTPLPDVPSGNVLSAATGKSHTLVLIENDGIYSVGSNKCGQCGVNKGSEQLASFRKARFADGLDPQIVQLSCGEDFSVALDSEGFLYSTGSSEYGQLGNGETLEYFITASKLAFANAYAFARRETFAHAPGEKLYSNNDMAKTSACNEDIRFRDVVCGKHHSLALEAETGENTSRVFSWGCGNYGVLGHGVQADEYYPRSIGTLQKTVGASKLAAGQNCSMLMTTQGHLHYWGKHRSVGEATMRPTQVDDLSNHEHFVSVAAAGGQTVVCSTSAAQTVAWGQGIYGELGLEGKKSSSKPAFVTALDGIQVLDIACGFGHTLYIVEESAENKLTSVDPGTATASLAAKTAK